MIKLKRIFAALLCITVIGSLTACGQPANTAPTSSNASQPTELTQTQKDFNTYLDGLYKDSFTNSIDLHFSLNDPSKFGIELEPTIGKLEHKTNEEISENNRKLLEELRAYSQKDLTKDQQLTYRILEDYITSQQTDHDFYYYGNTIGFVSGLQANYPLTFAEYKFNKEQDIKDYLTLLQQLDQYLGSFNDFLKEQSKQGLFPADFVADKAIEQIKSITNDPKNLFVTSFAERIDAFEGLDATAKQQYIDQNLALVKNTVIPSFQKLSDTISSLKGTGYQGGLSNVPNGKTYYEELVTLKTGSSKSVDALFKTLENRYKQIQNQIQQLSLKEPNLIEKLQNVKHKNATPEQMMKTLMEKSKNDYPALDHIDYQIKKVPNYLKGVFLSPAAYIVPPIDATVENTIYVNDSIDHSHFFSTMAHEGYPGHLYQNNYNLSLKKHPILSTLDYIGYKEGWAVYTELHSYEYDDAYSGNKSLMKAAALDNEYSMLISSVVDIGVNYYGWDLAAMNKELAKYGLPEMPDLYELVISEPGYYLQYYIGYLEIESLRQETANQLGDKFNLKDFNKVILETGPSSFKIIKEEVDQYIKNNR